MQPNPKLPLPQRKRPAHMPPVARHNEPVLLFVTIGLQPHVPALANTPFHEAFRLACADADAWSVGRYVIMPDHVHLFCSPAKWPVVGIKRWSGYLKERITKRLKAALEGEPVASRLEGEPVASRGSGSGSARPGNGSAQPRPPGIALPWSWQSDCWDTQLRSGEDYHEKWEYVRQNPVRKGLVRRAEDWPWQGEMNVLRW